MDNYCTLEDCTEVLETLENILGREGMNKAEVSACCAKMRAAMQAVEKGGDSHKGPLVEAWQEAKALLEKYAKYV